MEEQFYGNRAAKDLTEAERAAALAMYQGGATAIEVCEAFSLRSRRIIMNIAHREKFKPSGAEPVKRDPKRAARIAEMRRAGKGVSEIARIERIAPSIAAWHFRPDVIARIDARTAPEEPKKLRVSAPKVKRTPTKADHQIMATGGRYCELAAYAAANGLTHTAALQLWHRVRVVA